MPDASNAKVYTLEEIDLLLQEKRNEINELDDELSQLEVRAADLELEFKNLSNIRRELLLS
jgi:hypothetical protein